MNKPVQMGIKFVVGNPDCFMPIEPCPSGKLRIRFRKAEYAHLFVQYESGTTEFLLEDCGDHWVPRLVIGMNANVTRLDFSADIPARGFVS